MLEPCWAIKNSHYFWVNGMILHTVMQELMQSLWDLTVVKVPSFFGTTYRSYTHEMERDCAVCLFCKDKLHFLWKLMQPAHHLQQMGISHALFSMN